MATAATMALNTQALEPFLVASVTPASPKSEALVKRAPLVNPALEVYTKQHVEDLLEQVTLHMEAQLEEAEAVSSPNEVPHGIQRSHSRQIEVCLSRFKAAKIPNVSIRDYMLRLHLHCPFTTSKLLALVHYLTVLDVLYIAISKVFRRNTAHRLILTAIVMASKILDDRLIPQVRWSVVGGVNLHQLHGLELAFFFLMNGKCWITEEALITAGKYLCGGGRERKMSVIDPLMETNEEEIIWSNVGNRLVNCHITDGDQ